MKKTVCDICVGKDVPGTPVAIPVINKPPEGYDYWSSHELHTVSDWQYEVANGDTRKGYWEWVKGHIESDELCYREPWVHPPNHLRPDDQLICTICGDYVPEDALREHLACHNQQASNMDAADIRNMFRQGD